LAYAFRTLLSEFVTNFTNVCKARPPDTLRFVRSWFPEMLEITRVKTAGWLAQDDYDANISKLIACAAAEQLDEDDVETESTKEKEVAREAIQHVFLYHVCLI